MSNFHEQTYPGGAQPAAATIALASGSANLAIPATHDASCDSCRVTPIVGPRYSCTVRKDFDLCSACENKCPQPYPMTKLYAGEQTVPTYLKEHVYICDGCFTQPIVGPVFICTKRADFGLCGQCEGLQPQPYPMTKIYNPTQAMPICDPTTISEFYASIAMGADARREMFHQSVVEDAPVKPARSVQVEQRPSYYAPQRPPPSQAGNQQQQSVAHKVLNLHPKVQANALKVGGSMMKMFGNMMKDDNNNNNNN
jgi:Zinc finger, ZZ type